MRFFQGLRKLLTAFAPFDSSGPVPRNQQFLGILIMLVVFLTGVALSVSSLNDVYAVVPDSRLSRHYPACFAVLVTLECIFWSWRLDGSNTVYRISCRDLKWRVSQDLCGFLCCSEMPQYKRNHIQNHVLYGSVLVATLSSWYYIWLCVEHILIDVCKHFDSYVLTVDVLYHVSLVAHTWIQILIIFLHRRGTINADDNKLIGIVFTISLNFVIYFHVVFRKIDSSYRVNYHEACSNQTGNLITSLKHEHSFWVQPIGTALTVEFVVTLNTVLFSLWYHARLKKKSSTRRGRSRKDNRRVPESYNAYGRSRDASNSSIDRDSMRFHLGTFGTQSSISNELSSGGSNGNSTSTGNSTPRRHSDVVQSYTVERTATIRMSTHMKATRSLTGPSLSSVENSSIKIRKSPRNLPWVGLIVGIVAFMPLIVTSFLTYVDCSDKRKMNGEEEVKGNYSNSTPKNSLIYSAVGTASSGVAVMLILCSLCILSHMRPMKCLKLHEKIDITVLFITITGLLTLSAFSLTAVSYTWPVENTKLKGAAGAGAIFLGVHGILQTIMITKSYATQSTRRDSNTCRILWFTVTRKTLGKLLTEMYIILLMFNITQWFTGAFHEHQNCSVVQDLNVRFYPKELWSGISRLINPLSLSYYFASTICYVALISRFAAEYKKPRFRQKASTRVFNGPSSVV